MYLATGMSLCLVYRLQKILFDLRTDGFIEHNGKKRISLLNGTSLLSKQCVNLIWICLAQDQYLIRLLTATLLE